MMRVTGTLFLFFVISGALSAQGQLTVGPDFPLGFPPENNFATIQEAIDASSSGDTILVAPGNYGAINYSGKSLEIRSFIPDEQDPNFGEIDPENTVIDGGMVNSAVRIEGVYYEGTILDGFTVTNGSGRGDAYISQYNGGGIFVWNAQDLTVLSRVIIRNNIIRHNENSHTDGALTGSYGGGIGLLGSYDVDIIGNTIRNNFVRGIDGGSGGSFGGGISANGFIIGASYNLKIENNDIYDNIAWNGGGGIWCHMLKCSITNNRIFRNELQGINAGSGGGIYAQTVDLTVSGGNIIYENMAGVSGGGIYHYCPNSSNNLSVHSNWIHHNKASDGGGIFYNLTSWPVITNNVIYGNEATHFGGGIYSKFFYGTAYLINNTIANNDAVSGGGMYFGYDWGSNSTCEIWNSIFKGSSGGDIHAYWGNTYSPQVNIHNCDCGHHWAPLLTTTNVINEDPLFIDPDNGDYQLDVVSPCLDAGDNSAPNLPTEDIDGNDRIYPIGGIVDMGAYEYAAPPNYPPVADAGDDQTVDEGSPLYLDGSGSSDPEGQPLAYEWTQLAGPTVVFDPYVSNPAFFAPFVAVGGATLTFQLVVNDGVSPSEPAITNVIVKNVNNPPVALAGEDQALEEGSPVSLDGTDSYDPDSETLTYLWEQLTGELVFLSDPTSPTPSFEAPLVGVSGDTLTFSLTVSDGIEGSTDYVDIVVENVNHAPVAEAGDLQTVDELTEVALDGTGSSDPDGDALSYAWVQVAGPIVTLSDSTDPSPLFTAPEICCGGIATLTFELTVSDPDGAFSTDSVTVMARDLNAPPDCSNAYPSKDYLWPPNHKMVSIDILGVVDPDDQNVTITVTGVTQDEPINGLGDGDTSPDAVIQGGDLLLRSERSGLGNGRVYRIDFIAVDNSGGNCSGYVTVFVPHSKKKPIQAVDDGQLYDSTLE